MRKGSSMLVEAGGFLGLGSAVPKGDSLVELDSKWALPISVAFGDNGVTATAQCSLQGLIKRADGTYRYTLLVHTLDVRNSCAGKDLEPSFPGNGDESPGSDPSPTAG